MTRFTSPLRYPGGKTALTSFLAETLRINNLVGGTYLEPFAGGAGAALTLLFSDMVASIYINDKDPCIYRFWKAVTEKTNQFAKLVWDRPVTVEEWQRQREIIRHATDHSTVEVGFATFYLNRCNHSGVLNAGPIGGLGQKGDYKIDARFNKEELVKRIERIGLNAHRIHISNDDAVLFLRRVFVKNDLDQESVLVYMDPPYYRKGHRLYAFYFKDKKHEELAEFLRGRTSFRWILSCDNAAQIRRIYRRKGRTIRLNYCVRSRRIGRERLFSSRGCRLPLRLHTSPLHEQDLRG